MRPSINGSVTATAGQWSGPVVFSVAVHLSLAAGYLLLSDSYTPPQPPAILAVEIVMAHDAPGAAETHPAEPILAVASTPAAAAAQKPVPHDSPKPETPPDRKEKSREPSQPLPDTQRETAPPEAIEEPKPVITPVAAPAPMPDLPKPPAPTQTVQTQLVAYAPPPKRKPVISPPPIGIAEKHKSVPEHASPHPDRQADTAMKRDTGADASSSELASAASAGAATARLVPPRYATPGRGNPLPDYPRAARRRGIEGRLLLRVAVSAAGQAEKIEVIESSGHELLDRAAEQAVWKWRFEPGRRAGIPVSATIDVPVVFRLRE